MTARCPARAIWHQVNKRTRTPTNAIWLGAVGAFILGLPYLWNTAAYGAVTSIAVIGLYIAYVIPIFLRLRQGDNFKRGPWHLGRWSYVIGWIGVSGSCSSSSCSCSRSSSPITLASRSTTRRSRWLVVIGFAGIYWLVSARKWFKGPKVQGTPEELAAIERELSV